MLKSTPTCPLPDIREARIDPTLPVNERLRRRHRRPAPLPRRRHRGRGTV